MNGNTKHLRLELVKEILTDYVEEEKTTSNWLNTINERLQKTLKLSNTRELAQLFKKLNFNGCEIKKNQIALCGKKFTYYGIKHIDNELPRA